ncbi:DUF4266 domain-containing protein [Pontibacter sp. BT310]|jgi:uncharacterized lipoprotein|uniref:DUF4266 domain-containing protein n=1 Tax=Pontibacter populi TaxID=890055 RepID=A0ABS6XAH7_9BACT|nr:MULTISPECIES: DUF4266 domain-containing protein [Pontibacter]MBJ6118154.1 DUF4266 domain-containing protein [Pontibacter sp. BT310]MBR0570581.1 DUF4266 domain-containing protein [Microvirga sp. STS03]MBW3365007.1 DUF4266 domain-containing protein [Pontibacter populi]
MKTHLKPLAVFAGLLIVGLLSSCETVKPYQKSYLNEEEMQLSARKVQTFEMNFESYREGASGATGGKMGGGCGCN